MTPSVSVVICTFNRAPMLRRALEALRAQLGAERSFELIVVDNNSTDRTAAVIREAGTHAPLTCLRETRQGLSFARNRGVAASHGDIVAFSDDDVCAAPDWIDTLRRVAAERPEAAWFGGRVLPVWPETPPSWLGRSCWAPLALLDYGDCPFTFGGGERRVAIGANLAVRRSALDTSRLFRTDLQRVAHGAGSTEDHELQVRLAARGLCGRYEPRLVVHSPVDVERMTRAYHRRWHTGHGRFFARMRDAEFERSSLGRLLDVPAHAYRSVCSETIRWAVALLTRDGAAFDHELRARFFGAYIRERIHERLAPRPARVVRRIPA